MSTARQTVLSSRGCLLLQRPGRRSPSPRETRSRRGAVSIQCPLPNHSSERLTNGRTVCSAVGEDSLPDVSGTAPEVFEWDVVQFRMELPSEPALVRLGRVVSVADETCTVEPMAEQSLGLWVLDGEFDEPETISLASVSQVIEADYGQRAIEDRVSNPHGEHAEEVWEIQDAVDAAVFRGQPPQH